MERKVSIPKSEFAAVLRGYQASPLREYSNNRRHVYFSAPLQHYIVVRALKSGDVELEFTPECPCGTDD
jgi:hypothetical protein